MFERIRGEIPKVATLLVFDGAAPDGMTAVDPLDRRRLDRRAASAPDVDEGGATMIYTSGTTGKPKGALPAHGRRSAGGRRADAAHRLPARRHLPHHRAAVPLGPRRVHGAAPWRMGQTVVLQRKFDPEDWLRLVETYRVTSTFSAPTPIRMICNLPAEVKAKYDRSSMRLMIANAAPWSFALKQQYVADFPPESLFEVYGSTELGVNTILRPEDQLRKPGSCGKAAPMVEIRLFDERRQRRHRDRPGRDRASCSCAATACSPTTTSSTTSSRRTTATGSRPSATSPTATTRASSTSATARRT